MYAKDQASKLKQAFWTAFGQYIAPQLSAEGLRINWINYKTGIKHLNFKLHADHKSAFVAIELSHPDTGVQELLFEQFKEFRNILKDYLNEDWVWEPNMLDENYKTVSRIYKPLNDVSIFKEEDWPELISFLKPRIIALDEFWCDMSPGFELFK